MDVRDKKSLYRAFVRRCKRLNVRVNKSIVLVMQDNIDAIYDQSLFPTRSAVNNLNKRTRIVELKISTRALPNPRWTIAFAIRQRTQRVPFFIKELFGTELVQTHRDMVCYTYKRQTNLP